MVLPTRSPRSTAVYARVLDGAHLWLAVRGEGPLALRGACVDVVVPTEERDGLLTAVVDLREVLAGLGDDVPVALVAGAKGRPVRHEAPGTDPAASHDGRAEVVVEAQGGHVVVVRRRLEPVVEVSGFATTADGVACQLGTRAASVSLVVAAHVVAELPLVDGRLVLADVPDLPPGATATFRVAQAAVVRRRNVLARPHLAVGLPPMAEPDVELRWLRDGRLALVRAEVATP